MVNERITYKSKKRVAHGSCEMALVVGFLPMATREGILRRNNEENRSDYQAFQVR